MPIWSAEIKDLAKLYESFKGQLPDLDKELGKLIKADDENMILLYSRRCLEVIITDLCECELNRPRKTEPLKGIIDRLQHEERVPSHIITSMHNLNSLSTYGAHPKDFDPEQVKPVLNNLDIIIKWYLKYKDSQTISKQTNVGVKDETKVSDDTSGNIQRSTKKLILLIFGVVLVVIVVLALFIFDIMGGKKQIDEIEKSIAVLPFENWSSEEEFQHLGDAIANEINTYLSLINQFHVVSYTSSSHYKGSEKPPVPQIGRELAVNFIIEGTVERQLDDVSIHVQVIKAADDDHLWAQEFRGKWKDIFTIRANIAKEVTEELNVVLTPQEKVKIAKRETDNPEAYNLYLQGRVFWYIRTEGAIEKSVEYFKKAIEIDSNYALAFAGLADAYFIQAYWGWIPWLEGTDRAKETVLKALNIDKNLSEAHAALGWIYCWREWKWEDSRKELKLAIELNPNYTNAHHYYSELLDVLRENEEARKQINIALEIDPFLPVLHALSASYYYHAGRFKEALDECHLLEELDPEYYNRSAYRRKFDIYLKQKEELKAVAVLPKAIYLDTLDTEGSNIVVDTYNNSGISGLLKMLIKLKANETEPNARTLAGLYNKIGNKEYALFWLEKAFENPPPGFPSINNDPAFENLRTEPRFQALIEKMGLSDYQIPK